MAAEGVAPSGSERTARGDSPLSRQAPPPPGAHVGARTADSRTERDPSVQSVSHVARTQPFAVLSS